MELSFGSVDNPGVDFEDCEYGPATRYDNGVTYDVYYTTIPGEPGEPIGTVGRYSDDPDQWYATADRGFAPRWRGPMTTRAEAAIFLLGVLTEQAEPARIAEDGAVMAVSPMLAGIGYALAEPRGEWEEAQDGPSGDAEHDAAREMADAVDTVLGMVVPARPNAFPVTEDDPAALFARTRVATSRPAGAAEQRERLRVPV